MKALKTIGAIFLEVAGVVWLLIEITNFFNPVLANGIRQRWWAFFLIYVLIVVYRLRPKRRFRYLIDGRDIAIEVVIGNILKEKGPIIIGSNTQFETSPTKISSRSVQGAFTSGHCTDRAVIDAEISTQAPVRPVKFGTTVTVHGADGKIAYFCAIAELNSAGVAKGSIEDLRLALGQLWNYLATSAEKSILNVPILGSGFSRIGAPREELVREIILSFMAAVSESAFCDGLRLVIYPKDIRQYKIDVGEISKFVEYNCKYAIGKGGPAEAGKPETS